MRMAQLVAVSIGLALAVAGCGGGGSAPSPPPPPPGEVTPLAFVSDRDGDDEIYLMKADGTGLVNVTNDPAADDHSPAWSPDRTRIAYSRNNGVGGCSDADIFVVNAATGAVTQLTESSNQGFETGPCWSPDGTKIAYSAELGDDWVIHVVNADGSGTPVPLAGGLDAAWSPDGTKIAYTSMWEWTSDLDIHVMNATDGSGQTNLTADPDYSWGPAWSPDGTEIAFFSSLDYSPPVSILKMSSAGGPFQSVGEAGFCFEMSPCWSPDGSKIVFSPEVGDDYQIHIINADGTGYQVLLAAPGVDCMDPDWCR